MPRGPWTNPASAKRFIFGMLTSTRPMRVHMRKETKKSGVFLAAKVREGIQRQAPGGMRFKPLEDSTITRKDGKSLALIDDGDLLRSIKEYHLKDTQYLVGVHRTVRTNGKKMANIGAVHEFGSKDGRIPKRPFLQPTFDAEKKDLVEKIGNGVTDAFFRGIGGITSG